MSEILGIDKLKYNSTFKFNESNESFACEKINLSFSTFVLGVHKKAQDTAVSGELGRYPIAFDIIANIISYMKRFEDANTYTLLKEAYTVSNIIHVHTSWSYKCKTLKTFLLENNIQHQITRKSLKHLHEKSYEKYWKNKIRHE